MSETVYDMVVDDAGRLHPGIDDHRADEREPTLLKRRRNRFREWGLRGDFAYALPGIVYRRSACQVPDEGREILTGVPQRQIGAGVADGRHNLGAGANDAGVGEQPRDVRFAKLRHNLRPETLKRLAEGFALAQDRCPGQAGLKPVEHELFPERPAIALRNAPLLVVVGAEQ